MKTTKTQKIARMAVMNGSKNMGHLKTQINATTDKQMFFILNRLQRRGIIQWERGAGRNIIFSLTVATEAYAR